MLTCTMINLGIGHRVTIVSFDLFSLTANSSKNSNEIDEIMELELDNEEYYEPMTSPDR